MKLASSLASRYPKIDVLTNNAGAVFAERQHTPDGYDRTWQVNVLSPALLADMLLPTLLQTERSPSCSPRAMRTNTHHLSTGMGSD